MILKKYRHYFNKKLQLIYPEEEINAFFYLLAETYLGIKKVEISMQLQRTLSIEEYELFEFALLQLQEEKPIQYVLGKMSFYGLPIQVNKSTLIPRPETEELVDWIIKENKNSSLEIVDLGTGSGCIAVSLAKYLNNAELTAVDISKEALLIAKKNAKLNEVNVKFIQTDILSLSKLPTSFDIIVSNPPYVRNSEKQLMQSNVLSYEPHKALFVCDKNPLLFYKKITEVALESLNPKGILYFEINEAFGEEVVAILENKGFNNIQLKKDIYGKDRMISASI